MSVANRPVKCDPLTSVEGRSAGAGRVLRLSLRLFGSVDLLALIAVVMPVAWMRIAHPACGLGEFPEGPLPVYLARSTSLLYAFHGAVLWCLSMDIVNYQRVIGFMGRVTVVFGLALVLIDLSAGMPLWWTLMEGPVFTMTGLWLMWWNSRQSSSRSACAMESLMTFQD